MIKSCVIGASGYTGAELVKLLDAHPHFSMESTWVSQNSLDANKNICDIHPHLFGVVDSILEPLLPPQLENLAKTMDAIFLATPHEASHDWMSELSGKRATIFDLSGAFRIKDTEVFSQYYGFEHKQTKILNDAVYGLADFNATLIKQANVVAVPGCYPTASLTALKPLQNNQLIDPAFRPIINAISGVSGAGRKAAVASSFCEVSLQAYGVLGHRHQPEIAAYLGTDVIFTPHLGNFKRGILATITVKTADGTTAEQITDAYHAAYDDTPIVRILNSFPKLDDVVHTPHCDLFWKFDPQSGYLVIGSAIDNLLKGAASQAIQCANLKFGFASEMGLLKQQSGAVQK